MSAKPARFEQLVEFQFAEPQPEVRVKLARLLEIVAEQVEDHHPPARLEDAVRRRHRPRRLAGVMERLAEDREVHAVRLDGRRLDVAQAVFEVGETVLARQRRAELDHLFRVVHRDDLPGRAREELGERALARAEVGDDHRRQQPQEHVRHALPRPARAIAAAEFARQPVEIFPRPVLALAQDEPQRDAVRRAFGDLLRAGRDDLPQPRAGRVGGVVGRGQPVIDVLARAPVLHQTRRA